MLIQTKSLFMFSVAFLVSGIPIVLSSTLVPSSTNEEKTESPVEQIMESAYEQQQTINSEPFAIGDSLADVEEEWGPVEDLSTVAANYWSHEIRFMYEESEDEQIITAIDDFNSELQEIHLDEVKEALGEPQAEEELEGMLYVTYTNDETEVLFQFESARLNDNPALHMYTVEATEEQSNESAEEVIRDHAQIVVEALQDQDFETISEYIHPERGASFSPYAYIRAAHQTFSKNEISDLMADESTYIWGSYDGTGYDIDLTPADYYEEFLYHKDFVEADEIVFGDIEPRGSSLHNADVFYPSAEVIEFYVAGSDEYAGLDWGSLMLAFEEIDGEWYLIAFIHDEWTV